MNTSIRYTRDEAVQLAWDEMVFQIGTLDVPANKQREIFIRALTAAGYAIVPVEPTEKMMERAAIAYMEPMDAASTFVRERRLFIEKIYKTMLDAFEGKAG